MKVSVYIGEDKVDLFDDEKISITQKLNDIEKLSNVFTDFTNSFTVPATPNNNRIFNHYYDVDIAGSFNANIRIGGFIEIDTLPFKFGEWQLEGVTVKQHVPDNYKVTFYSKATQLTKLFGDDTLSGLDYVKDFATGITEPTQTLTSLSRFNYLYNSTNFYKTINDPSFGPTGSEGSIITPLIAYTDRDWNYGSNNTLDISINTAPVLDSELLPAIKCIRLIEGIETKYGITFTRGFFGTTMFNKLYMWMNNSELSSLAITPVDFTNSSWTGGSPPSGFVINTTDNYILTTFGLYRSYLRIDSNPGFETIPHTLKRYEDGVLVNTWPDIVGQTGRSFTMNPNKKSTFTVESNYIFSFRAEIILIETDLSNVIKSLQASQTLTPSIQVYNNVPNMKVIDFLQGIMKMFKLIIRPETTTRFYIDTLDNYYYDGNILDITKYVDQASIQIDRPVIYDTLKFKFQKTDNIAGKKFREYFDPVAKEIGYGDERVTYPLIKSASELVVDLPFENMLFERMSYVEPSPSAGTQSDVLIGQSVVLNNDNTVSKNNSKPILFFNNGTYSIADTPIYMKFGTDSPILINTIYNIGNTDNIDYNSVTNSINWGEEEDPWHNNQLITPSLINNYWKNWLETIYDTRQRKFKFEGYLPPRYIQELSLNDALIIGQNRYNISDYTIDLVTGKTTFNLFNDIKKQQTI